MGDIAFLLLIFIVLLARARDESHLVWQPATGTELVKPVNKNASVVIDKQNVAYLNGRPVQLENLAGELKPLLGNLPAGSRTVLFKVHKDAIAELTPAHRAVILLREVDGLSYKEISDVGGCSMGTVMSRLHYARKKLHERLGRTL